MQRSYRFVRICVVLASAVVTFALAGEPTQDSKSVNETPANFTPKTESFDYVRRTEMIPMRDGVKLYTVIVIPRGAKRAPILLTRTPYDAAEKTKTPSAHLARVLGDSEVVDDLVLNEGYIRVIQDVRGKHHSEGVYLMNPPPHGTEFNPTNADDSTDANDTIDWLVKNVPESNGKVGILGISYDGFTTLAALIHPHPALRARDAIALGRPIARGRRPPGDRDRLRGGPRRRPRGVPRESRRRHRAGERRRRTRAASRRPGRKRTDAQRRGDRQPRG